MRKLQRVISIAKRNRYFWSLILNAQRNRYFWWDEHNLEIYQLYKCDRSLYFANLVETWDIHLLHKDKNICLTEQPCFQLPARPSSLRTNVLVVRIKSVLFVHAKSTSELTIQECLFVVTKILIIIETSHVLGSDMRI